MTPAFELLIIKEKELMLRGVPIEVHRVHRNRFDKKLHLVGMTRKPIKKPALNEQRGLFVFHFSYLP